MTFEKGMYSNSTWTVVNKLYIVKLRTESFYLMFNSFLPPQRRGVPLCVSDSLWKFLKTQQSYQAELLGSLWKCNFNLCTSRKVMITWHSPAPPSLENLSSAALSHWDRLPRVGLDSERWNSTGQVKPGKLINSVHNLVSLISIRMFVLIFQDPFYSQHSLQNIQSLSAKKKVIHFRRFNLIFAVTSYICFNLNVWLFKNIYICESWEPKRPGNRPQFSFNI